MKVEFKKYKVKVVPKKKLDNGDYLGMNQPAGKEIKSYKGIVPAKKTVYVSTAVSKKDRPRIGRHEIIESELMTKKKMAYKPAHKKSNKLEKLSKTEVNKKVK